MRSRLCDAVRKPPAWDRMPSRNKRRKVARRRNSAPASKRGHCAESADRRHPSASDWPAEKRQTEMHGRSPAHPRARPRTEGCAHAPVRVSETRIRRADMLPMARPRVSAALARAAKLQNAPSHPCSGPLIEAYRKTPQAQSEKAGFECPYLSLDCRNLIRKPSEPVLEPANF